MAELVNYTFILTGKELTAYDAFAGTAAFAGISVTGFAKHALVTKAAALKLEREHLASCIICGGDSPYPVELSVQTAEWLETLHPSPGSMQATIRVPASLVRILQSYFGEDVTFIVQSALFEYLVAYEMTRRGRSVMIRFPSNLQKADIQLFSNPH